MIWVVVAVVVVLSFVVAAVVIGAETRRLSRQRHLPVYRLEEAATFVADNLPFEAAAQLTHDEVGTLLRWHLNALQFQPGSMLGELDLDQPDDGDGWPLVVSDQDTVAALSRRARREGIDVTTPDVAAVVATHHAYLQAIGAIGEVPRPTEIDGSES